MIYRGLFWLVLVRVPAETAHRIGFAALRTAMAIPGAGRLLRRLCHVSDERLGVDALGRRFSNPLGLAAGFDKDAYGVAGLAALGFGFVEVGTVTAQPQTGNPRPRIFRLPADRALVNRMGFNNSGSLAVADRLHRHPRPEVTTLGVNIGKTKVVEESATVSDYVTSARRLLPLADYLVVNVSSPNTPGLRNLQATSVLRPLLSAIDGVNSEIAAQRDAPRVPLLVKIAPDLADEDIDAVAELALELDLDGIIATNTTIARAGLATPADAVADIGAGGLSGAPLRDRSLEVLQRLRAVVGDRLTLISVGGVENADDVFARICCGATLVQAYTGLIYGGPLWPRGIQKGLLRRLEVAGLSSISQARGRKELCGFVDGIVDG
ncbi:quinone-dependent dihydroorotate dehydrogenase [Pseudonocardia sp. TRM90224]|uniref:quinone-dependent dihydroorotate dehydrogenase n=1 Tax=Pseudonocardia sp. TRM90224 TaxID=2812678 RepID=UPI001E2F00D4|nr:quinone-dependent dihydroorotate dehydrogenase [Pseudonocardia sp. TRM90224]